MHNSDIFFDRDMQCLQQSLLRCRGEQWSILSRQHLHLLLKSGKEPWASNHYPSLLTETDIDLLRKIKKSGIALEIHAMEGSVLPRADDPVLVCRRDDIFMDARLDLDDLSLSQCHKGHRYNIRRAEKLGVTVEIIAENLSEPILADFFAAVKISRKNIGQKDFAHDFHSFLLRKKLVEKRRAVLAISCFREKKSYVLGVFSRYNGYYWDSGYNIRRYPFTAHYAQYRLMRFLQSRGCRSYCLGIVTHDATNSPDNAWERVEYYKKGFCKKLRPLWIVS